MKFKKNGVLHEKTFIGKLASLFYYVGFDIKKYFIDKKNRKFNLYGMTCFVGRQGGGKTISMVNELDNIKKKYPKVKILTNFGYIGQDEPLDDWQKLIDYRSSDGVVFAIDEIQNEFDLYNAKNFNLDILRAITQQRKQGIKILATSQVFTRVSKPLREQCYEVVICNTFIGRLTFNRCYDADQYNLYIDSSSENKKTKIKKKYFRYFVQDNNIRSCFDTYLVIKSMKKLINAKG